MTNRRVVSIERDGDPKALRETLPNAGIEAAYRKKLKALIAAMQRDIVRKVVGAYEDSSIAQDDMLAANRLQSIMDGLARTWLKNFDEASGKLADWFGQKTKSYTDGSMQKILKDSGFAVEFKMTRPMQDAYSAVIHENVGLIRSIAAEHLQEVQGLVMRSVQAGGDAGTLVKELTHRYGITKRRAALIARDQNNKATAVITRVRQEGLGITHAYWKHSHAGRHPRPSHVKADGEVYEIAKGMYLDGKYVWPGTEINCRCRSRSIIYGLEKK